MSDVTVHLLTIVSEAVLQARLTHEAEACGAGGWTVTPCLGHSRDGTGAADFEGGNVRIEVLVAEPQLEILWRRLSEAYFDTYSVVAWSHPVRVQRPDKYRFTRA